MELINKIKNLFKKKEKEQIKMETTKFKTIANAKNEKLIGKIIFTTNGYGKVLHATPLDSQSIPYLGPDVELIESTERELLKAWSHSTIERKYGPYATREPLRQELDERGFTLNENGYRWKKKELAIV